jgi:argininosuccinate lyase
MKLWQKDNYQQNDITRMVEQFTAGNDRTTDMRFAAHDVIGSIAHATMLKEAGIVSETEFTQIKAGLEQILAEIKNHTFSIEEGVEDIHSQVEKTLTERIGDAGKKLHTGRSRNDQVLTDIKLLIKDELKQTTQLVLQLFETLQQLSEKHKDDLLPGYTHLQLAMPSSFGLWFGAYAESLADDMELMAAAYKIADKNPLGSGAGYGSAFPLNRQRTTQLLHFSEMNYNSVYAQMTRGKVEKATLTALAAVAATLSKLAYDVCFYINPQLAYLSFPEAFTTGSSIMPHKKNPDVFELIRAKCNVIQSAPHNITLLTNNLPSGYHRDLQLTKEILFAPLNSLKECIEICTVALQQVQVRKNILSDKQYDYLFSVDEVNKLVIKGAPFRDAYKTVGNNINTGNYHPDRAIHHTHEGSISNLCNDKIKVMMDKVCAIIVKA